MHTFVCVREGVCACVCVRGHVCMYVYVCERVCVCVCRVYVSVSPRMHEYVCKCALGG